jgi:hypothetical protein
MVEISKKARAFVEKEHSHTLAATRYFEKWNSTH